MSLTCANCGHQNDRGTQFCANPACGAYLHWDQTAGHQQAPQQSPRAPQPPPAQPAPAQPQTARHPRVEPEQRAGLRIELAQPALAVEPGQTTETRATVHNTGTRVERLTIRVSGPAAQWAAVEPADLSVYPGQSGGCTITFTPPRNAASSAGAWKFGMLADSQVTPGLQASAVGSLTLGDFRALTATLEPSAARGGGRTRHSLLIDNQGNVPEEVRLSAADGDGLLQFELPPGASVNPGRSVVPFRVKARQEWFGKPKRVPFRVVVTPAVGQPVTVDGVRIVRPRLGVLPLVLAGVLLAVLAGAIALSLRSSFGTSESNGGGAIVATEPGESPTEEKPEESPTPMESPTPQESMPPPEPTPEVTTPAPPPVNPATQLLVEYHREGGFAGFADRITVFGDGHATVTRVTTNVDTNLTPDELTNLKDSLENLELGPPDPEPGGGDHIKYELVVDGNRSVRYNSVPPDWQSVIDLLNQVIERQS